jgi:hypothetical protein
MARAAGTARSGWAPAAAAIWAVMAGRGLPGAGHLEKFAGLLREAGHDPVILRGGMGAKSRAAALARLQPQPGGPPLLAVATGPYVGEGFDCPAVCRVAASTLWVVSELSEADLDALVAQATVDCYNEDEELAGLAVMLQDNLAVPFQTAVLGVTVIVRKIDQTESGIVAICVRGKHRQAIPVLDLPLPDPPPRGAEWIAAYRHWAG